MEHTTINENEYHDLYDADLRDATYSVYSSKSRHIRIKLSDKALSLLCEDYGDNCRCINGEDSYEFVYHMDKVQTEQLIRHLREKHGEKLTIRSVFIKEFGYDDGTVRFDCLCEIHQLKYHFFSN